MWACNQIKEAIYMKKKKTKGDLKFQIKFFPYSTLYLIII